MWGVFSMKEKVFDVFDNNSCGGLDWIAYARRTEEEDNNEKRAEGGGD